MTHLFVPVDLRNITCYFARLLPPTHFNTRLFLFNLFVLTTFYMIDHLLGRPSVSWKRSQVFLVILFWVWRLRRGSVDGPKLFWIRRINRALKRFTPWQIIVSFFTLMYAGKNLDSIVGLGSPEPLAHLYSRSYYRATWLVTGLDAGFATAMSIQPKWLRDLCSVLFSAYYILYANKADEKLRKYRAIATVEMLRTTWEKTTNPYLRIFNAWDRPGIRIVKKVLIPRPQYSSNRRPVVGWLFFDGTEEELSYATELILDLPGGGFICMTPLHHEERLRRWAIRCKRPVLSIDYGKAPEYPFPFALEECFDVYRTLVHTRGACIGMSGSKLRIIMSGDSAGGNLVVTVMYKILESPVPIPRPVALVFSYAALDFNFGSWMSPAHLRVLRSEQSTANIAGLAEQKDHFSHRSPLAVVNDIQGPNMRRRRSWTTALSLGNKSTGTRKQTVPALARTRSMFKRKSNPFSTAMGEDAEEEGNVADEEDEEDEDEHVEERDKPLSKRVVMTEEQQREAQQAELSEAVKEALARESNATKAPIGTRLTMTSRTGYFQDRIISPSMMRAMAILYIGPKRNPDFEKDYYLSPILGPSALLAEFPPMLMSCGEKDPFVDDTVIFAGRVREAKRMRRQEVEAARRRVGESLRMTGKTGERILEETEEDWVRLAIIEGWSHGYLQMSTLMPEAREAIYRIGEWICDAFGAQGMRGGQRNGHEGGISSETETDEGLMFVPKKKRSPASSFGRSDRSSDETLIGQTGRPTSVEASGVQGTTARAVPAGKAGALVPEADLLKRRREEAVFGIGDVRAV